MARQGFLALKAVLQKVLEDNVKMRTSWLKPLLLEIFDQAAATLGIEPQEDDASSTYGNNRSWIDNPAL